METKLLKAIAFAGRKHMGQMRKDGKTPYFSHPVRVMTLVNIEFGCKDVDTLCAAVLHDTIEDTTTDRDDIEQQFGRRVAKYVVYLTKDKRLPEERREHRYFKRLAKAPLEVKLCKLGDTLDNLLSCMELPPESRKKTVSKAKLLLKLFAKEIPKEYAVAMERVREQLKTVEAALPKGDAEKPA
jgi:guanosine-3',5'-bis(diphosphate) 3'-pyrophosphohydrolase